MEFGLFVDPVNLTQRHTLYDSDEEDENDKDTADITISDSGAVLVKEGGTLLVAVGTTASIFAQSHVSLVDSIVCSLVANSQTVFKGKFFPSPKSSHTTKNDDMVRVSEVYAVNSNSEREGDSCYVCVHEKPLKPEYCNAWASKVFECVRPSTVVLFTSCNAQDHFSPNTVKPDPCCMLRSLQTSNWSQPSLVSTFLEPPNTIAGEAAAVLTHCQISKIPAAMAVLYADTTVSTSESMSALQMVLKHPLLSEILPLVPLDKALMKAKQLAPKPRHDLSTLFT